MKTILRSAVLVMLAISMNPRNICAQNTVPGTNPDCVLQNQAGLTDQQKENLKIRREKQSEFTREFRASISKDQQDILDDPRVMPQERQKQFRASLTDSQVAMIKVHKTEMRGMREDFRASLSPEQKEMMRNNRMNRVNRMGRNQQVQGAGMMRGPKVNMVE